MMQLKGRCKEMIYIIVILIMMLIYYRGRLLLTERAITVIFEEIKEKQIELDCIRRWSR
jgi:hypothetical protein